MNEVQPSPTNDAAIRQPLVDALTNGDFQSVVDQFEALATEGISNADLKNLAAMAYFRIGRRRQARSLIEDALATHPDHPVINNNAGNLYWMSGYWKKARNHLEKALTAMPDNPGVIENLSQVYAHLGDKQKAEQLLLDGIRKQSGNLRLLSRLAGIALQFGDKESARKYLFSLIQARPRDSRILYSWVKLNKVDISDAGLVNRIGNQLEKRKTTTEERANLNFCLAEIHRNSGHTQQAFGYYRMANSGVDVDFDPAAFDLQIEQARVEFSPDWWQSRQRLPESDPRMIFIVGMPRSGTSLTEQILDSHSRVFGAGELNTINEMVTELAPAGEQAQAIKNLTAEQLLDLRTEYLERLPGDALEADCIIDKAPMNFLHIGLIKLMFPNAIILWCERHPMDTILSCYFQIIHKGLDFCFNLGHLAHVFARSVELRQHWNQVLDGSFYTVQYEQLVRNPEVSCRALLDACELEWEEAVLKPEDNSRAVLTASNLQVRESINTTSIGRWLSYRDFLKGPENVLAEHGIQLRDEA